MCGICGMLRGDPTRSADAGLVAKMNAALVHRGPDDEGVFSEGPCAIGVRRLSVIDVEHGHQPMTSTDGRYAIAFNGEIYNAPQLREELERGGSMFKTRCDTEVLLNALLRWGDAALERLNGMFAFAFYDCVEHRLLLARDRVGIKPLFVVEQRGDLYFASEIDALLRSGRVSGRLDPASIDAYFKYLYVPGPATIFADVSQLEPGEFRVYHRGRISRQRYWTPQYQADPSWTLDSAAERYGQLLHEAVRLQKVSDVPLGAFLSGGMDSASVVAALAESSSRPIDTFTIGFDDLDADERVYAEAVAQKFGTSHTTEVMRPDVAEILPGLIPHFGQPFADSSALPTYLVSTLARKSVTVALSGDGGDELFAGYTWLHMTRRVDRWRRVPEPLRRLAGVLTTFGNRSPSMERVHRFNRDSFFPTREAFRRRQTCFYPEERAALYRSSLQRAIEVAARDRFAEYWDSAEAHSDDDRMLNQDLRMYLPDDILSKVDRMSMAVSLELRVPLLDHRIIDFAGTLPFDLKYRAGMSKRVPRYALRTVLPELVLKQRKRGFSIPIDRWFRERLGGYAKESILGPQSRLQTWLDPHYTAQLWDEHQSGKRNYGHRLWVLLVFEQWLRYVAQYVEPAVD